LTIIFYYDSDNRKENDVADTCDPKLINAIVMVGMHFFRGCLLAWDVISSRVGRIRRGREGLKMAAAKQVRSQTERRVHHEQGHGRRKPPIPPDYDDEITVETISRLNKIVSDDEFVDYKDISGPAW
jgi:hypothetical protein